MLNYIIVVENERLKPVLRAVRSNMPTFDQMLERAHHAGLPKEADGETLADFIRPYDEVPSGDLTMRVYQVGSDVVISQSASGGGDSRIIKDGLRKIVKRHLVRELRAAGYTCRSFVS